MIMKPANNTLTALALHHFVQRRLTFASGLKPSRCLRLIAMSVVLMFISIISTSITLWYSTCNLRP